MTSMWTMCRPPRWAAATSIGEVGKVGGENGECESDHKARSRFRSRFEVKRWLRKCIMDWFDWVVRLRRLRLQLWVAEGDRVARL